MKVLFQRAAGASIAAAMLASCGGDVDVCSNPGGQCTFDVTFEVRSEGDFGALQLDITHLGDSGGFLGQGDKVDCVALVDAIVASNWPGERTAKVGMISLEGIRTPGEILRCGFRTSENLRRSDFVVEVTDASDTESHPVEPVPTVVVSSIHERDSN